MEGSTGVSGLAVGGVVPAQQGGFAAIRNRRTLPRKGMLLAAKLIHTFTNTEQISHQCITPLLASDGKGGCPQEGQEAPTDSPPSIPVLGFQLQVVDKQKANPARQLPESRAGPTADHRE